MANTSEWYLAPIGMDLCKLMRRINKVELAAPTWTYDRTIGGPGTGDGEFQTYAPQSVEVYDDKVYGDDTGVTGRVEVFDLDGTWDTSFSPVGFPIADMCVTQDGETRELYVANHNQVDVWSLGGSHERTFGSYGTGNGEFDGARGIHATSITVYVSDLGNDRIQLFTPAGTYKGEWSTDQGGIDEPGPLSVYNNEVYVLQANGRCYVYSTAGVHQRDFAATGDGIHVSQGRVYIADSSNNHIAIYQTDGTWVQSVGSAGSGNGEFLAVYDVRIYGNEMFAADSGRQDIQVFTAGQTEFYVYPAGGPVSLGTPDGGVTVPTDEAWNAEDGLLRPNVIEDMRNAIEAVAPSVTNPDTSNPFNWTPSDPDNLYYVAMGDRTKYGATGGAAYDWTRDPQTDMPGTPLYDLDVGEIDECITTLEEALGLA